MKPKRINPLILTAGASLLTVGSVHAAVITDFSTFSESGNLVPPTTGNVDQGFTATTGINTNTITIGYVSGSTVSPQTTPIGQEVYLSDSFSLSTVGATLIVDFGSANFGNSPSFSASFGLAIATTEANSSRQNMLFWNYRKNGSSTFPTGGALQYVNFDGSGAATNSTTTFSTIGVALPDSLFITKTAAGFDLGYIEGGVSTVLHNLTSVTASGAAVGVFSDMRQSDSSYVLNSLRLIPEPSSALLGSLGLLALLRRRRA